MQEMPFLDIIQKALWDTECLKAHESVFGMMTCIMGVVITGVMFKLVAVDQLDGCWASAWMTSSGLFKKLISCAGAWCKILPWLSWSDWSWAYIGWRRGCCRTVVSVSQIWGLQASGRQLRLMVHSLHFKIGPGGWRFRAHLQWCTSQMHDSSIAHVFCSRLQ